MIPQLLAKKNPLKLVVLFVCMMAGFNTSRAQNLALTATADHSGGGVTVYGPTNYNDNVISTYIGCPPATAPTPWGWLTGPSTTNWIEFTWTTAQTLTKVVFFKADRPMYSCTIQWWDGATYQTAGSYSNSAACYLDSITFTAVTTTKLRLYGIQGSSNPNFREIQIYGVTGPCTGTPNTPVITTTAISAPLCSGATTNLAATSSSVGSGLSYQWQQSASATGPWSNVSGGVGATTLAYTTAALTAPTYFRMGTLCGTTSITSYSTAFFVPVGLVQPGAITGSNTFCPNASATYTVPAVTGASSYTWTLPSGWTGTSTTNSIVVTAGSAGGTISVTATGTCGTSVTPQTLAITLGTAPAAPASVSGNNIVCNGATQTYGTAAVTGATSYLWTLPSGWSGTSTGISIIATPNSTAGSVTVKAVNNCGSSAATALPVTITTQPAVAGPVTGAANVCAGAIQQYTTPIIPNVLSYTWTTPSGWTGTSATNVLTTTVGTTSGNITVSANNGCGLGAAQNQAVAIAPLVTPAVSASTSINTICAGTPTTFTAVGVNGGPAPVYQWKQNGVPVGINSSTFSSSTLSNNDVITVVMTSSATCPTSPTTTSNSVAMTVIPNTVPGINVNATTPQDICSGTSVTFFSNITGGGTAPQYQWKKNGSVVGSNAPTYTSAAFVNGDTVVCVLTTNAICPSSPTITSNKMGMHVSDVVIPSVMVTSSSGTGFTPGVYVQFTAAITNGGNQPLLQWVKNGLDQLGETGTTYTTNTLENGDLVSVRLVSNATCAFPNSVTSNKLSMHSTTSVSNVAAGYLALNLAPNPNKGQFSLMGEWAEMPKGKQMQIDVINTVGQTVYTSTVPTPDQKQWSLNINLKEDVINGLYILRVVTDGSAVIKRFELNR